MHPLAFMISTTPQSSAAPPPPDAPLFRQPEADTDERRYVHADAPRNVYWEMTSSCDLACKHCRAEANPFPHPDELGTDEAKRFIDEVKRLGSMLILTGGDPMKRKDLFELIEYARSIKQPVSITPSTTPRLTRDDVRRFRELGVAAVGVSLDGGSAEAHDSFRGVPGTFQHSMNALAWAREFSLPVQVNTSITRETLSQLPTMFALLRDTAAPPVKRWALFILVPVGRGSLLGAPTATEVEELFEWVYDTAKGAPFHISTIEAPHYRRYWYQRKRAEGASDAEVHRFGKRMGFGIRDGNGVIFVSRDGSIYPAGFLPYPRLGNVRTHSICEVYRGSPALGLLRDMDQLQGKCGRCEHRWMCGGSRARAYAATCNPMGEEPLCAYVPE